MRYACGYVDEIALVQRSFSPALNATSANFAWTCRRWIQEFATSQERGASVHDVEEIRKFLGRAAVVEL